MKDIGLSLNTWVLNRGGSTTVAHTVVWRNSVVWCPGGNTVLW